jgi:hypothetical protein
MRLRMCEGCRTDVWWDESEPVECLTCKASGVLHLRDVARAVVDARYGIAPLPTGDHPVDGELDSAIIELQTILPPRQEDLPTAEDVRGVLS